MPIPHVDVRAQYAPLIPELKAAFERTLESGRFIFGPEVEGFEREAAEYLGVEQTIGVANGTDAIVLLLDALGIGPGDEVICPSFTFYATAEAIASVPFATPIVCSTPRYSAASRSNPSTSGPKMNLPLSSVRSNAAFSAGISGAYCALTST